MGKAACGWLWSLNCLALWQSQASKELWPSSAPLINSHSDRKPEPALQFAFMSHPICLQKPHFSLFTVSLPDWWSSILRKWKAGGGRNLCGKGLKCVIVCCWNIGLWYVLLVKPSVGCHGATWKRRPCSHTSRRNNNELQGLWERGGESGRKCFMIWQCRGQSK